ncbi:MAG: PilZ domain-containing protein [Humidesulfovibrio sp.]|nr:PilZ domain-containing protein [Humidesulfovibrio sp.]
MEEQPDVSQTQNPDKPPQEPDKPPQEEVRNSHHVERMPGVTLKLSVGATIFLRLLCVGQRYEGRIVGLDPYTYFIVQVRLPQDTLSRLSQNPNAIAQLDAGGTLFGFRTEVLNRLSHPAPLLFLSYPDTLERVVLRRNERVSVSIPGSIHGAFGDHEVIVVDLAPEGCCFTARSSLKSPLRDAKPGERVLLRCELRSTCGNPFEAPVVLRRVDEQHGRLNIGGQFVDLAEENIAILQEYMQRVQLLLGD